MTTKIAAKNEIFYVYSVYNILINRTYKKNCAHICLYFKYRRKFYLQIVILMPKMLYKCLYTKYINAQYRELTFSIINLIIHYTSIADYIISCTNYKVCAYILNKYIDITQLLYGYSSYYIAMCRYMCIYKNIVGMKIIIIIIIKELSATS